MYRAPMHICCVFVSCYRVTLSRPERVRLLCSPGSPLTVRAGCHPNSPFQRDASWPAAAAAVTTAAAAAIITREAGWVKTGAWREGGREDGSCQLAPSSPARWDVKSVVGLSASRRRLHHLYADGECNSLQTLFLPILSTGAAPVSPSITSTTLFSQPFTTSDRTMAGTS